MTLTPILSARDIKKRFTRPLDITILDGVDLDIFPGDSVAIMGRSGEGKSTLLQILGTLETPSSGTLEIMGKDTARYTDKIRNEHIGFVFQSFHLLEDFTALENVIMPARIGRKDLISSRLRGLELLDKVGLKDRASHFAKQLSGGERQRISIARAFFNNPDLILADEPTGNLDRSTGAEIQSLLLDFAHVTGKAILMVTHDPALAALCKRTYYLKDGVISTTLDSTT